LEQGMNNDDDDFAELFKKLPSRASSDATWQDVRNEFEALGNTLGDVLRGVWQRQEGDAVPGRLRDSFQALMDELGRSVEGTPEARQARDQLVRLSESIRSAAERASDELRPELLNMLRQANAELRRLTLKNE
jgi:hypothetical protein